MKNSGLMIKNGENEIRQKAEKRVEKDKGGGVGVGGADKVGDDRKKMAGCLQQKTRTTVCVCVCV